MNRVKKNKQELKRLANGFFLVFIELSNTCKHLPLPPTPFAGKAFPSVSVQIYGVVVAFWRRLQHMLIKTLF